MSPKCLIEASFFKLQICISFSFVALLKKMFSGIVKMIASFQEDERVEQILFGREMDRVLSINEIWVEETKSKDFVGEGIFIAWRFGSVGLGFWIVGYEVRVRVI